jgi:hypothetical protein
VASAKTRSAYGFAEGGVAALKASIASGFLPVKSEITNSWASYADQVPSAQ